MRFFSHISTPSWALALVLFSVSTGTATRSFAQSEEDADDLDIEDEDLDLDEPGLDEPGLEEPQLRAPQLTMPDLGDVEIEDVEDPEEPQVEEPVERAPAPDADPTRFHWSPSGPVLTLHGYLRMRGEIWDNFFLGRDRDEDPAAFRYFIPADRGEVPSGGCGAVNLDPDPASDGPDACAGSDRIRFGSMRLRLRPSLALSDSVRIHTTLDVFDNLVLGSTPNGMAYIPVGGPGGNANEFRNGRVPGVYVDSYTDTQNPPQAFSNSFRDSLYFRHAWAEITNRGLGQLRFGRMPSHWGLGMLQNAGNDLDGDYSTDVDRILLATSAFGLSGFVSYDFADRGMQRQLTSDLRGVPFDATSADNARQFSMALAWREAEPEAQARLLRGDVVVDTGLYFIARRQELSSNISNGFPSTADDAFFRRDARVYTPDFWARLRWKSLRLELEMAGAVGEIGNVADQQNVFRPNPRDPDNPIRVDYLDDAWRIAQFGVAFEGEYRLLEDKLFLRLYTGFATGDPQVDGMSRNDDFDGDPRNPAFSQGDNRRLSQFSFHPNYRVDLILWRHLMGAVSSAWYLRFGGGYDIIRAPNGNLFGLSADVVYSRAAFEVQTYGSNPNLGVELDLAAYYRTSDGPGFLDGFYASFQYGVLFSLPGLGYLTYRGAPEVPGGNPGLGNAQTLRLILGVQY